MDKRISILHKLAEEKEEVIHLLQCGIISTVDAASDLEMIKNKENRIKESLVLEKHIGKGGNPRKISYVESKGLYSTKLEDGSKLYGKTRAVLIDKLFDYYGLTLQDTSVKAMFEAAIDAKEKQSAAKESTIKRIKQDYAFLFYDDFLRRDIREIKKADILEYIKRVALSDVTYDRLKSLKTILNLIFNYAIDIELVCVNPISTVNIREFKKLCKSTYKAPEDEILTTIEVNKVKAEMRARIDSPRNKGYFANAYMGLFAIETGCRVGELCALQWADINLDARWYNVHAQQCLNRVTRECYYDSTTKDEKGVGCGGRKSPLYENAYNLLIEIKAKQQALGIKSEYVFAKPNGQWVLAETYEKWLNELLTKLGIDITGNHIFRKSLNSNTYIAAGLSDYERAAILGHSAQTNTKHYSFTSDEHLDYIRERVDEFNRSHPNVTPLKSSDDEKKDLMKFCKA